MSVMDEDGWFDAGNNEEEKIYNNIVFYRSKNDKKLSIDCPVCKSIIYTIEDVQSLEAYSCCEDCYNTYCYPNKNKWEKGWRPKLNDN